MRLYDKIRTWLIFKLVGDQPIIMNIDVDFKKQAYNLSKPILYKE